MARVEPSENLKRRAFGWTEKGVTWVHSMKSKWLIFGFISLLSLTRGLAAPLATIAGTGEKGYSGDGGLATMAKLNNPFGITRGPDGWLYFCEYEGHVVRRIDQKGIITTTLLNPISSRTLLIALHSNPNASLYFSE